MTKRVWLGLAAMLLVAGSVMASNFRAGDSVYLPAAGRAQGGFGAFFKTDVFISNLSTDTVVVSIAFAPTGNVDNRNVTASTVDLPTPLAPGERREIVDIMKTVFNQDGPVSGFLIFFACRQGGNCSACPGADCDLISVEARIYNDTGNGTLGQLFPGIPWYGYVSMEDNGIGLGSVFLTGIRNDPVNYRTNIGLVNASQYSTTVLRARLFNGTGTLLGTADVPLNPLGHLQYKLTDLFPSFPGSPTAPAGSYVTVEQISATPIPGQTDAAPGFLTYGSVIDNHTNDPTTLESQYTKELPWDCIYSSKPQRHLVKKP